MDYATLRFESTEGIATVTLNRPEQRNALNLQMCDDLFAVMAALHEPGESRVILFRGAGPVFCSGADMREREDKGPDWVRERRHRAFLAYEAIVNCALPTIAVVHGPAVGSGCEIATSCDFIVAAEEASFRYPEISWGTVGATQRLPRIVGKAMAKELLFTGRKVAAEEAVRIGLANRAVPAGELDAAVLALARDIAKAPPLTLRLAKTCVDLGTETDLSRGISIEMMAVERALADAEWRKGVDAFAARRGESRGMTVGDNRDEKR